MDTFWTAIGSIAAVVASLVAVFQYREARRKGDFRSPLNDPASSIHPEEKPPLGAAHKTMPSDGGRVAVASDGAIVSGWIAPAHEDEVLESIANVLRQNGMALSKRGSDTTGIYLRKPGKLFVKFYVRKRPGIETDLKRPLVQSLEVKGDIGSPGEANERLHDQQTTAAGVAVNSYKLA